MTGVGTVVQRYYASAYGRFNTPDRSWNSVSGFDPGSWNRYTYVSDDPVNSNDPNGLCAVMIAGITMSPGGNPVWQQEAQTLGADTAYPYQGQGPAGSIGSVIQQAFTGWNAATTAAYNAIIYAIGSSSTPVDIVAYSGGAGAFTAAWAGLTAAQKAMIGQILYISPGSAGAPLAHNGQTSYEFGSGLTDGFVTFGNTPVGGPITSTNCAHTDLTCLFGAVSGTLSSIQADGPCSSPEVFTLTNPQGLAGVGRPSVPKASSTIGQPPTGFFWVNVPWLNIDYPGDPSDGSDQ
jgi:RHS repeat-associated protein